jgi:hypothetical protein
MLLEHDEPPSLCRAEGRRHWRGAHIFGITSKSSLRVEKYNRLSWLHTCNLSIDLVKCQALISVVVRMQGSF